MSILNTRPALRWLVPAAAATAVLGGGAAIGTLTASADPSLPPRSAAQLLVDLRTASLDGLSGTVVQRADLGLPALSGVGGQTDTNLSSLVSGTHTLRVWHAGPDHSRIALLGTLGETDVIRNGRDVWVWKSQSNEASHSTLSESAAKAFGNPTELPSTPQEAAERALAAIDPSTEVTVGRSATIAGRDAYELILTPRDAASLVGQVRIAIDAEEHVPLRFEVFASADEASQSAQPVFEVAFTQIDFSRPDLEQFAFNPPPGTKVTEETTTSRPDDAERKQKSAAPTTVGSGWTTVAVLRMPEDDQPGSTRSGADATGGPDTNQQLEQLLAQLPKVSGDWGSGRLLTGKLFSALLTDDGRLLVGAVAPERLYEVAAQGTR